MREFMKMDEEERNKLLAALRDALQPRLLRRTNAIVQHSLPDKVNGVETNKGNAVTSNPSPPSPQAEVVVPVRLSKAQRLLYQQILKEHAVFLGGNDSSKVSELRNIMMQVRGGKGNVSLLEIITLAFLHLSCARWRTTPSCSRT